MINPIITIFFNAHIKEDTGRKNFIRNRMYTKKKKAKSNKGLKK